MEKQSGQIKKIFLSEVKEEIGKYPAGTQNVISENDIALLPLPVQNYIRSCGYVGRNKMTNARIIWKDVLFRRNQNAAWMNLDCYQLNSVQEPCRIVYMKSNLFGFFPFEGRDKYQDGKGNMLIKLLKLFTITDAKSKEMDISALVTVLAETLLLPSQALQSYIRWIPVDDFSAKAVISFGGIEVSGIFEFNENYEMTRFVTEDRYQAQKDNSNKNIRWSGLAGNYCQKDGIKFPSLFEAVWHQDNCDFEYFKGTIDSIEYDVAEFDI
jgi:hypothetical protein